MSTWLKKEVWLVSLQENFAEVEIFELQTWIERKIFSRPVLFVSPLCACPMWEISMATIEKLEWKSGFTVKFKLKATEKQNFAGASFGSEGWLWKRFGCFSIFNMIFKAILCVQHFCSFDTMLFIVNLLTKTDSTIICVPCMLEHVCFSGSRQHKTK